jgi:hypothetical protein
MSRRIRQNAAEAHGVGYSRRPGTVGRRSKSPGVARVLPLFQPGELADGVCLRPPARGAT